jgi:response regulator RpfG family c-di-GMP phosphodiesterase
MSDFRDEVMQVLIEKALNEKDPDKRDLVQLLIKYCSELNPGAVETHLERQAQFLTALAQFLGMNLIAVDARDAQQAALVHLFQVAADAAGLSVEIRHKGRKL